MCILRSEPGVRRQGVVLIKDDWCFELAIKRINGKWEMGNGDEVDLN